MTITAETVIVYLTQRLGVRFSTRRGEFIWNANGRPVATNRILAELERLQEHYKTNVTRLSERLQEGTLSLPQWQARMRQEIRDVHRTQYIIGRGGRNAMTQRDWGRMGASLRWDHYRALDSFAQDIYNGRMTGGAITVRSQMYVSSSNNQFWMGRTAAMVDSENDEERRILHPAEHCADCINYAAMGWQPLGTLPEPGEASACKMNCRCSKIYRKRPTDKGEAEGLIIAEVGNGE